MSIASRQSYAMCVRLYEMGVSLHIYVVSLIVCDNKGLWFYDMLQGVLCQFQLVLQILSNQSNADFKEQQLDFSSAAFVAPWVFLLIGKRFLKTPLLRVFPAHGLAEVC